MTNGLDTQPENIELSPVQNAALEADDTDSSDRVALVAVHPGELDLDALMHALMELRRRHDVLRTTVCHTHDGPAGIVDTRTVVPVELVADRPPHPADWFPRRRFDLVNGPLIHVALSYSNGGQTFLQFQAHPVTLDEETARRAVHELGLLYRYFVGDGPIPPPTGLAHRDSAAGVRPSSGRVPRRMPVVSREIDPAIVNRVRLIASSHGLPVALLVLAAWIAASAATSGTTTGLPAAPVAVSLPDSEGRRPLGPTCNRILLQADEGRERDIVALAAHLHAAMSDAGPDDGGTPVTFTFSDDRGETGVGPFEIVETDTMLAPSEIALAIHSTPPAGWLLRLVHGADATDHEAKHATIARTAALLENAGTSLVDEELV